MSTRQYILDQICFAMGGRVADELVIGDKTAGASNDIEKATDMARRMVTEWGMSDEIGPLNFASGKQEVFLGRDFSQGDHYSEETARRIDAEIRRIVSEQYERAVYLLEGNRATLELIAEKLLEYETLDGNDIARLCRGESIDRPPPEQKANEKADAEEVEVEEKKRPSLFPPIGKKDPEPNPA